MIAVKCLINYLINNASRLSKHVPHKIMLLFRNPKDKIRVKTAKIEIKGGLKTSFKSPLILSLISPEVILKVLKNRLKMT